MSFGFGISLRFPSPRRLGQVAPLCPCDGGFAPIRFSVAALPSRLLRPIIDEAASVSAEICRVPTILQLKNWSVSFQRRVNVRLNMNVPAEN